MRTMFDEAERERLETLLNSITTKNENLCGNDNAMVEKWVHSVVDLMFGGGRERDEQPSVKIQSQPPYQGNGVESYDKEERVR